MCVASRGLEFRVEGFRLDNCLCVSLSIMFGKPKSF